MYRSSTRRSLRSGLRIVANHRTVNLGLWLSLLLRLRLRLGPLALEAAHGVVPPLLEHAAVLVPAVAVGREHLLAGEDGVGARLEARDLLLLGQRDAAGREAHDGGGQDDARGGDGAQERVEGDHLAVAEGGALDGDEGVDGEGLRVGGQRGHGVDEADAVRVGLAQADDAAGADVDARVADVREGLEALVVGAGGDDGGVELARGVEVVVVRGQAGLLELAGLLLVDHAQRDADLHAHGAHAGDHLLDVLEGGLAAAHVAPGGAHAEARAAVLLGDAGGGEHVLDGAHAGGPEAGVVARGLGAVGAVLAAAAGLDVHERAHLDGGGVVEAAVDGGLSCQSESPAAHTNKISYRSKGQLAQRGVVDLLDLVAGPVGARGGRGDGILQGAGEGRRRGLRRRRDGGLDGAVGAAQDPRQGGAREGEGHGESRWKREVDREREETRQQRDLSRPAERRRSPVPLRGFVDPNRPGQRAAVFSPI